MTLMIMIDAEDSRSSPPLLLLKLLTCFRMASRDRSSSDLVDEVPLRLDGAPLALAPNVLLLLLALLLLAGVVPKRDAAFVYPQAQLLPLPFTSHTAEEGGRNGIRPGSFGVTRGTTTCGWV